MSQVQAQWYDSVSPSVSFLDISPAKAGREFQNGVASGAVPSAHLRSEGRERDQKFSESFEVLRVTDGCWIVEGLLDQVECSFEVVAYVIVVDAEDEEPVLVEPCVAHGVEERVIVRLAVEFYDELLLETDEVSDIWADWLLSAEADAELTTSQLLPQQVFEPRRFLPHLSCESHEAFISTSHVTFVSDLRPSGKTPADSSLGSLDGLKEAPSVSFLDISPATAGGESPSLRGRRGRP